MRIELKEIAIRDIFEGYEDNYIDSSVVGYGGKLNIRPKYQREFVYKDDQRNAVIDTVRKGFPLNVMYWVQNKDGTYEVLDGQQRTISICSYLKNEFSINDQNFDGLTNDTKEKILNYKLMIYFCEGEDQEKLDWFKTINIAGVQLTAQELRNPIYTGEWLTDAKKHFSKKGCVASLKGGDYLNGHANRQEYLETVLRWINDGKIQEYMNNHRNDKDADALWQYFQSVIDWVERTFKSHKEYKKEMKGIEWGLLYNKYKDKKYNANDIDKKLKELMMDDDVQKKSGIFVYLLDENEKHLNIRIFSDAIRRIAFEKQKESGMDKAVCPHCKNANHTNIYFDFDNMEADHVKPWHEGGKTIIENCQMLCKNCNRRKSGK
jgi:uncharacterized protein with ParB-like and HNH nuclease domain